MTTGEKIRKARINAGLTEKQLGYKIGSTGGIIVLYESNYKKPSINTLKKISSSLSVDLVQIVGDDDNNANICSMIKKYRKIAGLTQEELAKLSGISCLTVRKYERGYREPKISTLKKFADALGVNYKSLLPD